jgi:hypothetical protein
MIEKEELSLMQRLLLAIAGRMLYVRIYARALPPAASVPAENSGRGHQVFERLDAALTNFLQQVQLKNVTQLLTIRRVKTP